MYTDHESFNRLAHSTIVLTSVSIFLGAMYLVVSVKYSQPFKFHSNIIEVLYMNVL